MANTKKDSNFRSRSTILRTCTGEDKKTVDLSGGVKKGGSGKARGGACGVKLEKTRFHACGATRACLGERRGEARADTTVTRFRCSSAAQKALLVQSRDLPDPVTVLVM
ncbi:hypothetical protein DY000_02028821 [Brassica cretica]|uniref:Uncharacterized protein n=1 Tax=Brassica cretica TaxID=69181 RepID=A0ABQ7DJG1_BRACR|nr:hypothetical protein DY000_02028821 [Brassica cretica]